MILHITQESKFFDYTVKTFEATYKNKNHYIIIKKEGSKEFSLLKKKYNNITFIEGNDIELKNILSEIGKYKAVVLHNLNHPFKANLILKAPHSTHFHWLSWGFDIYNHPIIKKDIIEEKTKKILSQQNNLNNKIGAFFNYHTPMLWHYLYNKKREIIGHYQYKKIINRINSVSSVIPTDVDIINKYYKSKFTNIPFKVGNIEDMTHGHKDTVCYDDNILLGNSAAPTNNHIEAINIVAGLNLNNKSVYIPLSYGGSPTYIKAVSNKSKMLFGNKAILLTEFLPIEQYNEVLNSCGIVVMNHIRQQAAGNIILALWKGAKVFLNKKNPVLEHFKQLGIIIYTTENLNNLEQLKTYSELAIHNRPILKQLYGPEQVNKESHDLVKYLLLKNK